MRRRLSALLGAAALVTTAVTGSALSASAASTYSPLAGLATGPAPTVPYGIGQRIYAFGHSTDVSASFKAGNNPGGQFGTIVGSRGVAWASFMAYGADCVPKLGRVSPSLPWRAVASSMGGCTTVTDATGGGLAATPDNVAAFTSAGTKYATYPRQSGSNLGACPPSPGAGYDTARAAGYRFVVTESTCSGVQGKFLWYPGSRPQRLDVTYDALGRLGGGWLGKDVAVQPSAACWRVAPAGAPTALSGAPLCSMAVPLVSADGKRTIVVQAGRVRVLDTASGRTVSVPILGAVPSGWAPGKRYEVPAAWETSDAYLVDVGYDGDLALVRCSVSTGHCVVAVRSHTRTGVSDLITERSSNYAKPRP